MFRVGGHQQLVGVHGKADGVVFVERVFEIRAQTEVGGYELAVVASAKGYLAAYVGDVKAQPELALMLRYDGVALVIEREVGGEGRAGRRVGSVVVGEVGINPPHGRGD